LFLLGEDDNGDARAAEEVELGDPKPLTLIKIRPAGLAFPQTRRKEKGEDASVLRPLLLLPYLTRLHRLLPALPPEVAGSHIGTVALSFVFDKYYSIMD